jgi:hypothetical protein
VSGFARCKKTLSEALTRGIIELRQFGHNRLDGKDSHVTLVFLAQNVKAQIEPTVALVVMLGDGQAAEPDGNAHNFHQRPDLATELAAQSPDPTLITRRTRGGE